MNVYVRLLGEGTTVYRPVSATQISDGVVRLLAPENYDPEDEEWEFKPGDLVRIEIRQLDDHEVLVAVAQASPSPFGRG